MDVLSVALIVTSGIFSTFLITFLWLRAKTIPRNLFDELSVNFNEMKTNMVVSEEKFQLQKAETTRLSGEIAARDAWNNQMTATNAAQESSLKNKVQKIDELSWQLLESQKSNKEQQTSLNQANEDLANSRASFAALKENFIREKESNEKYAALISEMGVRINNLTSANSTLLANYQALNEKLATQKEEMTDLQNRARMEFEQIANKILEEKSGRFTETNRLNMEAILKPLGENIDTFKKKVEDTYDREAKERFSLEKSVKELIEQTNKVSNEANNLATALKGQSKKQGDWGEMILESILEKSGLTRGREYTIQESIKDESGKNQRPDVVVHLPENRKIIIDSKVSLVAYDKFCSAENPDLHRIAIKEHINAIYSHIDLLAPKRYDLMEGSLDFVMMFIPIEPAYLTAIQADQELWSYAYNKSILLISPTNLIAALRLVTDLWKREMQNRNALEIAKQGEKLYEKFVGFVDTMEDVGKNIDKAHDSYNKAIGQLKDGRGNLVGQALKLKNLGIKSDKAINPNMLPIEETEE
jgi:DNA recombination protein RmuC